MQRVRVAVVSLFVAWLSVVSVRAQTVMPSPKFVALDDNGNPCSGCLLHAYVAGTTTAQDTFSDSSLSPGSANLNPVVLDAAGRATVYLSAASYKFILRDATDAVTYWTQDNISANASFAVATDVTGTAGEALSAGNAVYLSDGSGGKTAGRWYQADADFTYASSLAVAVGMTPAAITSGSAGSIRLAGRVTGLSGLVAGTVYYVSATAGSLTSTAPANTRFVGAADSTTSLVLSLPVSSNYALLNGANAFTNTTDSTTSTTGAITTAGGLGVAKALNVGTTLGVTGATTLSSTLSVTGNVVSDLKFTDATYDVGKSGATRPRDGFFSRNVVIGGTLGVTGAATLSSTLGATVVTATSGASAAALIARSGVAGNWTKVTIGRTTEEGYFGVAGGGNQLTVGDVATDLTIGTAAGKIFIGTVTGIGTPVVTVNGSTSSLQIGGIAARAGTAGTNRFDLFDGTAPTSTLTNGVSLFSASGKLKAADAAGTVGHVLAVSSANVVSPTAQNRTLTVDIGGTTYYITAKTTND